MKHIIAMDNIFEYIFVPAKYISLNYHDVLFYLILFINTTSYFFYYFNINMQVGIALAFGITISVLAYSIGHISGGHINPAVTLAFMLLRLQSITAGLLYMVANVLVQSSVHLSYGDAMHH
jgi:hypothetical protein